jgi:hypothetical protein
VGSLDIGACSLCHCAVDYTDRAAFFVADRFEDYNEDEDSSDYSYYFRKNDPYLPVELYDPNNAIVYCDSCDRLYHQACHWTPVWILPRGAWQCLYCVSRTTATSGTIATARGKKTKPTNSSRTSPLLKSFFSRLTKATIIDASTATNNHELLFTSPPCAAAATFESSWHEAAVDLIKSTMHTTLTVKLPAYLKSQLQQLRLTQAVVDTWTSTASNRKHLSGRSQVLVQALAKLAQTKAKIRSILVAVERHRKSDDSTWRLLQQWCLNYQPLLPSLKQQPTTAVVSLEKDEEKKRKSVSAKAKTAPKHSPNGNLLDTFLKRVVFPFGQMHARRVEPRTPEFPSSVLPSKVNTKNSTNRKGKQKKSKVDDDDGISIDELTCCVCLKCDATDENDLILCDGQKCFRAYHYQCVKPAMTAERAEELEDWFCPLCAGIASLLLTVQGEYMGDEWEQRRFACLVDDTSTTNSLKSWADVDQVFPDAQWELEATQQLLAGKRTAATIELLATVLGEDIISEEPLDIDDDNVDDDGHFDLELFHAERQKLKGDGSSTSTHSSQATLVEMSSVELEIGKDELAALSDVEDGSSTFSSRDDDNDKSAPGKRRRRRSRRLRRKQDNLDDVSSKDPGKLDKSNIVLGKRGRKPVDYIRLNEAVFGDLSAGEVAKIDDEEDFEHIEQRRSRVDVVEMEKVRHKGMAQMGRSPLLDELYPKEIRWPRKPRSGSVLAVVQQQRLTRKSQNHRIGGRLTRRLLSQNHRIGERLTRRLLSQNHRIVGRLIRRLLSQNQRIGRGQNGPNHLFTNKAFTKRVETCF